MHLVAGVANDIEPVPRPGTLPGPTSLSVWILDLLVQASVVWTIINRTRYTIDSNRAGCNKHPALAQPFIRGGLMPNQELLLLELQNFCQPPVKSGVRLASPVQTKWRQPKGSAASPARRKRGRGPRYLRFR